MRRGGRGGTEAALRISAGEVAPRPVSVLVVDDSELYRVGLVRAVQAHDGLVLLGEADGGQTALDAIVALSPDVVLLDLRMPGVDGLEVLRRIRALHRRPPPRVLVISATLDEDACREAVAAGAAACLDKAVPRADICAAALSAAA